MFHNDDHDVLDAVYTACSRLLVRTAREIPTGSMLDIVLNGFTDDQLSGITSYILISDEKRSTYGFAVVMAIQDWAHRDLDEDQVLHAINVIVTQTFAEARRREGYLEYTTPDDIFSSVPFREGTSQWTKEGMVELLRTNMSNSEWVN